jgi:ATP-dependent DNA helicase PIF1
MRLRAHFSLSSDHAVIAWPNGVTPTPAFERAAAFLEEPRGNLFVTGRAGTGKSTLLKALRDAYADRMVILAPTGLAAINIGGQTIHSFFGFPPRLIQEGDIRRSRNGRVMRQLEFVVIDEASMVRSDMMWAIDRALRVNRGRPKEPFGGARILLFADMHQLPPVIQEREVLAHLIEEHGSPFFFSVPTLLDGDGTSLLELDHIFRQTDGALIRVLNAVRDGTVSDQDLAFINARVSPIRTLSEGEPYVILTTTNAAAKRINTAYLDALPGTALRFDASITGDFAANVQPADAALELKPAAKVMMLRKRSRQALGQRHHRPHLAAFRKADFRRDRRPRIRGRTGSVGASTLRLRSGGR